MKRILLVDDEKWVRTALKWTINKLGLPVQVVQECGNGLEALNWIGHNEADLVLTDIRMPVMDGLSFVKELGTFKEAQDVVVISVHDEFQFVQQALRSGVTDYLLKPIEEEDLRASLEKWLKKQAPGSSSNLKEKEAVPSTIEQVLDYIRKTPLSEVTLHSAAQAIHVNSSYLSQLFKQQLNKKFIDYLTELRIEEGKHLLLHTTLRMSEIAEHIGYADVAYFSNNFKKITGCTPSEFRRCAPLP
ncbi:response regulator transcription factor [Domibacillus indicus]|uniref:response regulator transcription factor n=1 Tax=Domibacillus indicus TaxID=1437523 RepID=UPI00061805EB|nr:response regulator [Domibacillus indicus]